MHHPPGDPHRTPGTTPHPPTAPAHPPTSAPPHPALRLQPGAIPPALMWVYTLQLDRTLITWAVAQHNELAHHTTHNRPPTAQPEHTTDHP